MEIVGDEWVEGFFFKDGMFLEVDLVVMVVGIKLNV